MIEFTKKFNSYNNKALFFHTYILNDISICDRLIESFENYPDKEPGATARTDGKTKQLVMKVNKDVKDSTDISLHWDDPILDEYCKELDIAVKQYTSIYKTTLAPNSDVFWHPIQKCNIQHYKPGGGYKQWHWEKDSINNPRELVFMTYLNDVTDGGGTEFYYQNQKFKARKGTTLIWPAQWMFTHRGEVSPTQDKYIITGWLSYTYKDQG